jgi:hypothetical protein
MIVGKEYSFTRFDVELLCSIVVSICSTGEIWPVEWEPVVHSQPLYQQVVVHPKAEWLLPLYYRRLYGGMQGDMNMLEQCLLYYMQNSEKIVNIPSMIVNRTIQEYPIRILPESVDFHAYPQCLNIIRRCMGNEISGEEIKKHIWNSQSCLNTRKPETIVVKENPVWIQIKPLLDAFCVSVLGSLLVFEQRIEE